MSCEKLVKFVLNIFNACKSDVNMVYIFLKIILILGQNV